MHCCNGNRRGGWKQFWLVLLAAIVAIWLLSHGGAAFAAESDSEQQLIVRRKAGFEKLPVPPTPPKVDVECFNPIDQFITARWNDAPQGPAPQLCDEPTFLRRVYLDLVGVIPT